MYTTFSDENDKQIEEEQQKQKKNLSIRTYPKSASFTGISGVSQASTVIADVPCFTGPVLGDMRFQTQALDNSYLPMLLCCHSMRELGFVINTNTDSIYIPCNVHAARDRRETQYYEVPLIWTGQHYLLPIDLADYSSLNMVYFDQPTGDEVHRSEVTEIEFPHKKILTAKD